MKSRRWFCVCLVWLLAAAASAEVSLKTEQLRPADPKWGFKTIPRPSASDLASNAKLALDGNQWEPAASDGSALVDGVLPDDSLDLTEAALLSNGNTNDGRLIIDLGRVQPVVAVASYSWHEWDVDQGSRAPQVYGLYASAAERPDPNRLADWVKIAEVDTRPNLTGAAWNGQHGVFITDSRGTLGEFRHLLFDLRRTRSPLQPNMAMTGTLFSEIDVHSAATLAKAGDAQIAPVGQAEHVWVVFKTHLDIGYTDTIEQVLRKYRVNMMEGALGVVEASRALPAEQRFSWTLAGWPLTHVLGPEQDPARRKKIEQALREGAITFHALPFTTHTETQDLEDLVRSLGFSTRLAQQFDRPYPISAKMTDVPSHSWVMPTLLAHAGVRFLHVGCNGTSAFLRVPRLFWWEGPDGSRILCNYSPDYGSGLRPPRDWPSKHYLAMEMTGDNHGPPTVAEVERLRQRIATTLPAVQVHFATLDDFARAVIAENPELPVVRGDMPDTWIHGWQSMPLEAKVARQFRPLEPALETLDTQLRAWGVPTPALATTLAEAYEQSALFSEHTFGPWGPKGGPWESGIRDRYLYGEAWKTARAGGVYRKYEAAFDDKRAFAHAADQIVRREWSQRLDRLASSVRSNGRHVVVYNALPWKRSGAVEVPGETGRWIYAKDVPANGYRTCRLDPPAALAVPERLGSTQLDGRFFRATFDLSRGGLASLVDKRTGREIVDQAGPYALGQFVHERFDARQMREFHDAYGRPGYDWTKGNLPQDTAAAKLTPTEWKLTMTRTATADVATLTAGDTLGLARGIALVFTLDRHQPFVEVEWRVTDKTPDPRPEGGWLCFPFALEQPQFRLGRLGGPVDPANDIITGANRHYFCVNTGVSLTGRDGAGMGVCPLDSSCLSLDEPGLWKFSLDYVPRKPNVFVNLYNNEWNTNFPEWQEGSWSNRVRLWPTSGHANLADALVVPAWEARLPLLAAVTTGTGSLPPTQAGLSVSRPGVLVTAFGQNPDGTGTLLRLWEQAGVSGSCTVTLPQSLRARSAQPMDLRGRSVGEPLPVRRDRLALTLRAFAPFTVRLD